MASLFERLNADRASRVAAVRRVPVLELSGESTELLPPGTGALILSREHSDVFARLQEAVRGQDAGAIDDLVRREKEERGQATELAEDQALAVFREAPVYGDLRYGGKTIVLNAITRDDMGFTRVLFPFAGGSYNREAFTFAEFARDPDAPALDAMVVIHQPRLTEFEEQILVQLPESSDEMKFGNAGDEFMATPAALVATVTAGIIVATVGTALGHCSDIFQDQFQEVINPAFLNANSSLAVRDLVQARQQQILRQ